MRRTEYGWGARAIGWDTGAVADGRVLNPGCVSKIALALFACTVHRARARCENSASEIVTRNHQARAQLCTLGCLCKSVV
jgi:hypothetical protein